MREHVKNRIDDVLGMIQEDRIVTSYPASAMLLVKYMGNCRVRTYRDLADMKKVSVEEVIRSMGSADGRTTYQRSRNRYLIAINGNRMPERVRWTAAHEIGHIVAGHFLEVKDARLPVRRYMEDEADYFAANFLAPLHAIASLHVTSPEDLARKFGLSKTAARWRWQEYQASGFGWLKPVPHQRPFDPEDIWPDDTENYAL
jgi:Zn-dependent peptidase ImmA (M78 family)